MFCLLITLVPHEYLRLSLLWKVTQCLPKCFVLLANCFSALGVYPQLNLHKKILRVVATISQTFMQDIVQIP